MSIHDKLFTPENLHTDVPEPPEWMNPTMVKLFTYHCEYFLDQDSLLKTGMQSLKTFVRLEYLMVKARVNNKPLDIEMNQTYKSYCLNMGIDSNVNTRINWLNGQNRSFEDAKIT